MTAQQQISGDVAPPPLDKRQLQLYRYATLVSGVLYLVWWKAVNLFLPSAFNPIGSRLAAVAFCLTVFVASFYSRAMAARMSSWFLASTWVVTLHYFYLFACNASDINWVVGTYIVVIGICACTTTLRQLVAYAVFVTVLSGLLIVASPALLHTIFLSGIVTILIFAYLGLRARLRLVARERETAERVQSLFDAVFEGIALHSDGIIVDANESLARMFGYQRTELLGKEITSLTAPESRAMVAERARSTGAVTYEAVGLRKDGSTVAIELTGKTHLLEGKAVRLTAIRDLTEQRLAERNRALYETARESIKIRDEFMLVMSHELKTPITNLKLQTEMAGRDIARSELPPTLAEKMKRNLLQTDRHLDRLALLIEDMLDSARIDVGKMKTTPQRMDLARLAASVVTSLSPSFQQAGCAVHLDADASIFVHADPARMEQVLVNLLTNALKYGAGAPVTVSLHTMDRTAIIAVRDGGIGISQEDQARIFDRFERAVSARHISGLGLGLFISKYIVEALGGRIEVASEPGKGSTFSVVLPLDESEATHADA